MFTLFYILAGLIVYTAWLVSKTNKQYALALKLYEHMSFEWQLQQEIFFNVFNSKDEELKKELFSKEFPFKYPKVLSIFLLSRLISLGMVEHMRFTVTYAWLNENKARIEKLHPDQQKKFTKMRSILDTSTSKDDIESNLLLKVWIYRKKPIGSKPPKQKFFSSSRNIVPVEAY